MHVSPDGVHALDPANPDAAKTLGDPVYKETPAALNEKFEDQVKDLHPGIMALIEWIAKRGNRGWTAELPDQLHFPLLAGGTGLLC